MKDITHKQARRFLHAAADGLIRKDQRTLLDAHLSGCVSCRAEAVAFSSLEARLKKGFQAKWRGSDGPSENVIAAILSRSRRITMSKRINIGLGAVASIIALIILGLSLNYLFLNLKRQPYDAATLFNMGDQNDDLIAFVSNQGDNKEIYVMNSDGSGKINLTQNPAIDDYLTWSPDGSHIAFVSNRDGNDNIYIMDPDGSNLTRLTNDLASDSRPVWSPDGRKIAYSSGLKTTNIYVVDINNGNIRQITDYQPYIMAWPYVWSSDSQFIFSVANQQLIKVTVNGGDIIPLEPQTDKQDPLIGLLSKDDSTFHYITLCGEDSMSNTNFCYQLKSMNSDGTNQKRLATLQTPDLCDPKTDSWIGARAKWSPDQTKILFAFTCEENGWVYLANADGSNFEPVTNYPILGKRSADGTILIDWSSNGESIVFITTFDEAKNFYILNINDALRDPSTRPTPIANTSGSISSLAWQLRP